MSTEIHRQVELARQGKHPRLVTKMSSGWVVMGEAQFLPGYCLLLPDPVVPHLNALRGRERQQFLDDMAHLGDALLKVTGALRINYEMLGNLEPALHVHLFPRYEDEPESLRTKPVWFYDWDKSTKFDAHGTKDFIKQVCDELGQS